jgi:sugar lactone lactonase YvrE
MVVKDRVRGFAMRGASWLVLTSVLALLAHVASASGTYVPPAVISSASSVPAPGLAIYETDPVFDACGNIYTVQSGSVYSFPPNYQAVNGGQITEIPAGGGAVTVILPAAGPSYDTNSLAIDQAKSNLYVTEGAGGTSVFRIPIANCVPQTTQKSAISISNLGAVSYYWNGSAMAADAAGDVFIATNITCCGANTNELLEESPAGVGTGLLTDLAAPITSMVVDSGNNIYYVSAGALYELTYSSGGYSSTPVLFGGGYQTAIGVSLDNLGNMYVADSGKSKVAGTSAIFEIPYEAGTGLNANDQFIVAKDVAITGPAAIDSSGNLYYTNYYASDGGATILEVARGSGNLGAVAVGSTGATTLNVVFNETVKPASLGFVSSSRVISSGSGTTCAADTSYEAASTCIVSANFAPDAPGLSLGAFVMADSSGTDLATASIAGTGLGAGLTADPGTVTETGSGFKSPMSVALDASGDLFIADAGINSVWEVPEGSKTPIAIGSALNGPAGVAVDGSGNVYIADTGNNRIVEIPVVNGVLSASSQAVLISSGTKVAGSLLKEPAGVSLDALGNLYIADTDNNRVVFLPRANNWSPAGAFTLGSGFNKPLATTVTLAGLIYIADSGDGKVYSISYPTAAVGQTLVATGFNDPSALATDAAGDLFVVDKGNSRVLRIPNIAGTLATESALDVSLGIADPYGAAVDLKGNLYVSDNANAEAYVVTRTNSTQSFGKWNPNTTSDPASFQVENSGNQALTFDTPYFTASGDTSDFSLLSSESQACSSGGNVAAGASCTLEATFEPAALAAYSETLELMSNAKNAAAPEVVFTGTGATTVATTTTLKITSPSGTPYFGETIALEASVAASAGVPTGSVALLVDGVQSAIGTLTNGTALFSLPNGLTGGSHTLQSAYQGAQTSFVVFSRSESPVETIEVSQVATATTLSFATLYTNPPSQPAKTSITLTATVTPANGGIPTGTVDFVVGDSAGGTVTEQAILAAAGGGVFQASYVYTLPQSLPTGVSYDVISIGASYLGNVNYSGSKSAVQSFDLSPVGGSAVVTVSGTGLTPTSALTFTNTSYGGWTGVVGYQCLSSSLPANAICVFSPGQVAVEASTSYAPYPLATTQLTVLVNNPPNSPAQSSLRWWVGALTGLLLLWARRRTKREIWKFAVLLFGAILCGISAGGLIACNSSVKFVTPPGASTVTVIASADPYTEGSTSATQTCGIDKTTGQPSPTQPPCSQQIFQITLTVP